MEKVMQKLDSLREELTTLKGTNYKESQDRLDSMRSILERIVSRTYPENDAQTLIRGMYAGFGIGTDNEQYHQEDFVWHVTQAIRVIDTIKAEFELLGFDDFKPIKEKVESEYQIGSSKFGGFFKKKKTQEGR